MPRHADLRPGNLDLVVLEVISLGDVHGHGVPLRIARKEPRRTTGGPSATALRRSLTQSGVGALIGLCSCLVPAQRGLAIAATQAMKGDG